MLRSMFTAISSLNLHQSYLDVIANNLANANTTGYKANRVLFQDQFSQLLSPGAAPGDTIGGINPTQIGLGLQLGHISSTFTQGALQSTGRNLDLSIQGDGFFVYNGGSGTFYSRDGATTLDAEGYFVNGSTGWRLQGWTANDAGVVDTNLPPTDMQINTDRTIASATSEATLTGNIDAQTATGDTVDTSMGVYDSLGNLYTVSVQFTRTAASTWGWSITDPANASGSGTITFDDAGQFTASTGGPIAMTLTNGATTPMNITPDFSGLTSLRAASDAAVSSQNGLPTGSVSDVYIAPNDGAIFLVYSNGMREQVGQVALANFSNPSGLIHVGHTAFQQGLNSGEPQVGVGGSNGRGLIASGYLESSNVDMAQEFTNMILAQRGFQASSRVITTSDEILQELVNLKR